MSRTKLAICIPTYNRCGELVRQLQFFIDECINNLENIELYVADNKSQDETANYLVEITKKHPFINILLNDENLGLVGNLYNLLRNSGNSDYVWFVSDDDFLKPGVVSRILTILERHKNLGSIFLNSEMWSVNVQQELIQNAEYILPYSKCGLSDDNVANLHAIYSAHNTLLMWISAWILKRGSVLEVFDKNISGLNLTEPFLFAANSINHGDLYVTHDIELKNGTKLGSTWVINEKKVFDVHYSGLFRSILKLETFNFPRWLISDMIYQRFLFMARHNMKYFYWGALNDRKLTFILLPFLSLSKLFYIVRIVFKRILFKVRSNLNTSE